MSTDLLEAPPAPRPGTSPGRRRPPVAPATGAARLFALTTGLALLSRLPFLGPGYGLDADAWRVAWAAKVLATTGHYEASRFPGYPVQEIASALLVRGGPLALAGASALMAALAAGCFAWILRKLGSRDALLAGLALASTPALYLGSIQALDYAWALAFALAALALALGGRAAAAGALAGLAIGCRITSVLWLPPLALALVHARPRGARLGAVLAFSALALGVGAAAFAPPALTYGRGFLRGYENGYPSALLVFKNATVDLWGIPGTLALGLAAWPALRGPRRDAARPAARGRGGLLALCGVGIALFGLAFLRLPYEAAYLVPAVPLVLLLLALRLERRAFVAVCMALLLSPWLFKVSQPGKPDGPGFTRGTVTFGVHGQPFVLDGLHGPVLSAQARRREAVRYVDRVLARARTLAPGTVVVAGEWLPQLRVRLGGKRMGGVRFVYGLAPGELAGLRGRVVPVYALAGSGGPADVPQLVAGDQAPARPAGGEVPR